MAEAVIVKSAKQATEIAESVLGGYSLKRPIKAQKVGGIWYVQIDVGILKPRVADFKIDAKSGDILEYTVPESEG